MEYNEAIKIIESICGKILWRSMDVECGFIGMFDAKGCYYENDDADELFGDERDIATLIDRFGDRVIKPSNSDAIIRFFPE